eukprot:augustus_masked-scaffold_33-processed-gene-0.10-mRNA-1 protein AED:1.00 eAED:1.00 QI:0/-1/0/0/-1/1/1/0/243
MNAKYLEQRQASSKPFNWRDTSNTFPDSPSSQISFKRNDSWYELNSEKPVDPKKITNDRLYNSSARKREGRSKRKKKRKKQKSPRKGEMMRKFSPVSLIDTSGEVRRPSKSAKEQQSNRKQKISKGETLGKANLVAEANNRDFRSKPNSESKKPRKLKNLRNEQQVVSVGAVSEKMIAYPAVASQFSDDFKRRSLEGQMESYFDKDHAQQQMQHGLPIPEKEQKQQKVLKKTKRKCFPFGWFF